MSVRTLLRSAVACAALAASVHVMAPSSEVVAGPDPGLCAMSTERGAVSTAFAINACIDSDNVWLFNQLGVPITIAVEGVSSVPVTTNWNNTVENMITRNYFDDPWLLMPGDRMQIPMLSSGGTVTLANTEAGGFHALTYTAVAFSPGGIPLSAYQAASGLFAELNEVFGQYRTCIVGKNWVGRAGCHAGFTWDVNYAFGRAAVTGLAQGVLGLLLTPATFAQWAYNQPGDIALLLGSERTIRIDAKPTPAPTPAPTPPPTPIQTPTPAPTAPPSPASTAAPTPQTTTATTATPSAPTTGSVSLASRVTGCEYGPTCLVAGFSIIGFQPAPETYTCVFANGDRYDFPLAGSTVNTACYTADRPDSITVEVAGTRSNTASWEAAPATTTATTTTTTQPAPQAPQTFSATVGVGTNTWSNHTNAGGQAGPQIQRYATVQISCALPGFAVANGNTWWYRIASSPWNNQYYASADAFYNTPGMTSGPLRGTPYVDETIRRC